jgi:hypothetical protein
MGAMKGNEPQNIDDIFKKTEELLKESIFSQKVNVLYFTEGESLLIRIHFTKSTDGSSNFSSVSMTHYLNDPSFKEGLKITHIKREHALSFFKKTDKETIIGDGVFFKGNIFEAMINKAFHTVSWNLKINLFEPLGSEPFLVYSDDVIIETPRLILLKGNIKTKSIEKDIIGAGYLIKNEFFKSLPLKYYLFCPTLKNNLSEEISCEVLFYKTNASNWMGIEYYIAVSIYFKNKWYKYEEKNLWDFIKRKIKSKTTPNILELNWGEGAYKFELEAFCNNFSTIGSIEESLDDSLSYSYHSLNPKVTLTIMQEAKKIGTYHSNQGYFEIDLKNKNPYIPLDQEKN